MKQLVIFTILLGAACDRTPSSAPPPAVVATTAGQTAAAPPVQTTGVVAAPKPVAPKSPDYEDADGVVREEGGAFTVLVEGEKPICLPFEAPAEARVDGARVRFTLYLSEDATPAGCRKVQTLISMRVE